MQMHVQLNISNFFRIRLYILGGSGDISGLFSKSWFQGIVVVVQHALQYNG